MTEDDRQRTAEQPRTDPSAADAASTVSGASVASPGVGTTTDPDAAAAAARGPGAGAARPDDGATSDAPSSLADRPEVLAAGVFVGSFLLARILKRLVD